MRDRPAFFTVVGIFLACVVAVVAVVWAIVHFAHKL